MQPYGGDRVRAAGGKVILHSNVSKGWKPRVAKTNTHAEFPGTAVLWDDAYFEVVAADLLPRGGLRYVLEPWRDEHTIRVFDHYDAATEQRRIDEYLRAKAQQKHSLAARFAGIFLGQFPAPVQKYLENELGVTPFRMTMLSCIPSFVILGTCAWLKADAMLEQRPSPVPFWLWLIAVLLVVESAFRFQVAMLQTRGMGTFFGFFAYSAFWLLNPNRRNWPKPFEEERGNKLFTIAPPEDVALRDSLETRGPLLTLLRKSDQLALAERYGFDYRKHAPGLAWIILAGSALGTVSSWVKVADEGSVSALTSFILAAVLTVEQIARLNAFKHGPAGSVLAPLVRPFMRGLLERG